MRPHVTRYCLLLLVSSVALSARADETFPAEQWHVDAQPAYRLKHGWISFERGGDAIAVREYAGGGNSVGGLTEPVDISFSAKRDAGGLHMATKRVWKDKTAEVQFRTRIPKDAEVRVQKMAAVKALNETYQVLWRADVVQDKRVLKTVVYVARLAPITEPADGFDKDEVAKAKAVLAQQPADK